MNRKLVAAFACAVLIAGCNGGGSVASLPAAPGNASPAFAFGQPAGQSNVHLTPFNGPASLSSFEWGKSMLEKMSFVKPFSAGGMAVDVQVKMRDPAGLVRYALSTSDPKSPNYRNFLTPQQIADRFGATPSDYETVAKYFRKYGMRVGGWPQREVLSVTGSIGQFQRAFGTPFGAYRYGTQMVVGPTGTPHFTRALPVASVLHLQTYNNSRPYFVRGPFSSFTGYSPQMIASGLDYSGAYAAGYTGAGINVGINGTAGISPADVPAYGAIYHAKVAKVIQVNASPQPAGPVNGHTGTGAVDPFPAGLAVAPPITAACNPPRFPTPPNYHKCNPEDLEAQLDSEQVASLAPGATELFYLAYNPMICVNTTTGDVVQNNKNGSCPKGAEAYPLIGIQIADDSIQQTIADNRADVYSLSWGGGENQYVAAGYINSKQTAVGNVEFASLAAEGIATFVSSGDTGASECFDPSTGAPLGIACVSYPASDPNVTGVGGINLPLNEQGRLNAPITAWADNTTAGGNGTFENNVGSGGGISAVFKAPAYQTTVIPGITMREVPDMSLTADLGTGPGVLVYAGFPGDTELFPVGGTSVAAPETAALWGLVLQACKQSAQCATAKGTHPYRMGNAAPIFYNIYTNKALASYATTVYDVVYGNNQAVPAPTPSDLPSPLPTPIGYSAGPGYDMVTGIGAPFGGRLIDAVVKGATYAP
jgi:kumamolisin